MIPLKHTFKLACACLMLCLSAPESRSSPIGEFELANKLYEEGKFKEAIAAYEHLINSGVQSPAIYFNLGNAWYKLKQNGRSVAAYLQAERLAPRDPSVRFNLEFVRRQVSPQKTTVPFWQRALRRLSLNEWAMAAAAGLWVSLLLLAACEVRPMWRASLRGYALWSGIVTGILVLTLGAAFYDATASKTAVIIAPEVVVHYGPLQESQTFYKLRDGDEVRVLDQKINSPQDAWVQIQDITGRPGWVKRDEVLPVFSEPTRRKTA